MKTIADFVQEHEITITILSGTPQRCECRLFHQGRTWDISYFGGEKIENLPDAAELMWHIWHDANPARMSDQEFKADYGDKPKQRKAAQAYLKKLEEFLDAKLALHFLTEVDAG